MFSIITCLSDLLPHIKDKDEIRVNTSPDGFTIVCYMISTEDTFDSMWAKECRGITFGPDGKIAGRGLHKFFNVNEREESRVENLPKEEVTRWMDKRDGSMIHTVKVGDSFRLKSKKSFDSDVAKQATAWINKPENEGYRNACQVLTEHDATGIFEFTSPVARIVLPYLYDELRLLHVRDNESGKYWTGMELQLFARQYSVKLVDEESGVPDVARLIDYAKTAENIEGWILQYADGSMVKLKTDWYLLRHRAMTFLRERDIAKLILEEGLDDVKSLLVGDGVDITDILQIEARVLSQFRFLKSDVESLVHQHQGMTRKDFAIAHRDHEHFGLLMAVFTGSEPKYQDYFERHILRRDYSLRQLNLINSIAEPE